MTVRVTPMPAGAAGVEYMLNGSGCREQHVPEIGPVEYQLRGHDHEHELGTWWGNGARALGLEPGQEVTESDVRAIFRDGCDPRKLAEEMAKARQRIEAEGLEGKAAEKVREAAVKAARLGNAPYKYKSLEERVAARVKREGIDVDADPEAVRRIRFEEARKGGQTPNGFYDVTFSPTKSASLYYAALQAQGRTAEAERMRQVHREAVHAALEHMVQEAGYSRAGHHGKGANGRPTVGRFVKTDDLTVALFDHMTNRAGEPQLHTHGAVWNKVRTVDEDGSVHWRALDSRGLTKAVRGIAAVYEREFVERMEREFPVAFEMRPDGVARELKGVTEEQRMKMSSRRAQVVGQTAEWAAEYERRTGRPPSRYALTVMQQAAALHTRDAKDTSPRTAAERLAEWEEMTAARLQTTLADIGTSIEAAGVEARMGGDAAALDVEKVIAEGLERVQASRANWTRADLVWELQQALPSRALGGPVAPILDALADRALSGHHDVIQVQGLSLLDVPEELQREDGRSLWRPLRDERYTLAAHLTAEERVITLAQAQGGAQALSGPAVEEAIAAAAEAGRPLSEDQAAVTRRVLGGGRHVDVVVGPAGAGKSRTQGEIARAWTQHGGRVIGLAPSSIAAQVLQEEGIGTAVNTTVFLDRMAGRGPADEQAALALRSGDLVILDEAGMTSTEHIVQVVGIAERAGAKVVLVGDDAQLSAVEAGGLFRTLVRDVDGVLELETVRRFREADGTVRQWEADASLALRRGEVQALDAYRIRGRIQGGQQDEMLAEITRYAVADLAEGREAAVLTSTVEGAAEVAARIRDGLAALGKVEQDGVPLADGNVAGRGDLIQARLNTSLADSEGRAVLNRRTYRVVERHPDGTLRVQRVIGHNEHGQEQLAGTVDMPADYVRSNVQLGYAGTVHSVQGRTVRSMYGLVDGATSREELYVMLTRGWEVNKAFVVEPEHERGSALDVLAGVLEQEGAAPSSLDVLRDELDWIESLPAHGPIWSDLVAEDTRARHDAALRRTLSPADYERLQVDDAASVYRRLREAELAGHDVDALVEEAVTGRGFGDADSIGAVMYTRFDRHAAAREPERPPAGPSWAERTPETMTGPRGELARAAAELMDARAAMLGERVADEPPAWALQQLGPVPVDPIERAEWQQRAAAVESYREMYHVTGEGTVIGPPPGRMMVEQHAAWTAAQEALGRTPQERAMAQASDGELRAIVEEMERAQAWAPLDIADEMQATREVADSMAARAATIRRRAELAADPEERERLIEQARDYDGIAEAMGSLSPEWEQMHAERAQWYADTAPLRDQAAAARAELEAREADRAAAELAAAVEAKAAERESERAPEAVERAAEQGQEQAAERGQEPRSVDLEELEAAAAVEAERERGRTPTHMERWAADYEWRRAAEQARARGQEPTEPQPQGGPSQGQTHMEHQRAELDRAEVEEHERAPQQADERAAEHGQEQAARVDTRTQPAPAREALAALAERAADLGEAPAVMVRVEQTVRERQAAERAAEQTRREHARVAREREAAERAAERVTSRGVEDDRGPTLER